MNKYYIEALINELDKKWDKHSEIYEVYIIEDEKEQDPDYKDDVSVRYVSICNTAQKIKAKLIGLITEMTTNENHAGDATMVQQSSMTLKLPPCNIEDFEGGYTK